MKRKELKRWIKKEIKPAIKNLEYFIKTKSDKKFIDNASAWLVASVEPLRLK